MLIDNNYSNLIVKGLLKKHDAFRTDVKVHKQRVEDIQKSAENLKEKVGLIKFLITLG